MNEKKDRFSRLFPDRVKRLIKALDIVDNCSNKSGYEFDEDLVTRCWIEIAKQFEYAAQNFDVDFQVTLDGKPLQDYDTSKPLSHPK